MTSAYLTPSLHPAQWKEAHFHEKRGAGTGTPAGLGLPLKYHASLLEVVRHCAKKMLQKGNPRKDVGVSLDCKACKESVKGESSVVGVKS
ncbi:hypothetical protein CDAR_428511 [Caerostris darwini]|uniref:Uncharacterized protein n=1 Tax=Caerostris darwini TaxID=1538125 RepID=A0AAV4R0W7_9ARAC|nr:hypothetical protein CDAR_428511 [Caerostris darwini]